MPLQSYYASLQNTKIKINFHENFLFFSSSLWKSDCEICNFHWDLSIFVDVQVFLFTLDDAMIRNSV